MLDDTKIAEAIAPLRGCIHPLHENIGVEVTGVDLRDVRDPATLAAIKALWEHHQLVLFRKQSLSEAQQVAFSRNFGELAVFLEDDKKSSNVPEILRISNVSEDGLKLKPDSPIHRYYSMLTALWHTDGSYKTIPSLGSVLHALEVPPEGGDTSFANTIAAYQALDPATRAKIDGKHMVHNYDVTRLLAPGIPPLTDAQKRDNPPVTHPVVRTHADGRKGLFISANVAYYVGGMPRDQGEALHKELIAWATQPRFVYDHKWTVGDVLMWDNRGTMHKAGIYDSSKYRRVMQRTEIKGTEIPA
jgi:alpha-ketoglutarate-dependent taurine dioxygenase